MQLTANQFSTKKDLGVDLTKRMQSLACKQPQQMKEAQSTMINKPHARAHAHTPTHTQRDR